MRGGRLPTEPGLAGAEAADPPLVCVMGSQSSTFSLSWILYFSQAWRAGILVGGETRGDVRFTGYFLLSAGPGWTCQAPTRWHLLCAGAQARG